METPPTVTSSPPTSQVLAGYQPTSNGYDEWLNGTQPREHLHKFTAYLDQIGRGEFARRWEIAQRQVHQHSFASSGHGVAKGQPRPWELDPLPLLISAFEWEKVSAGLQQRAQLLNLVLRDLYGGQSLLQSGMLPADLVFSHPGFLRPLHSQQLPQDRYLHFYAADLARTPAGEWQVMADRTEAPSGVGYALENRVVISRMLPNAFQACRVQRLAPFFIAAREMLRGLAPEHRENPRVVVLSHGPSSPNYFEDAYLTRYLGYSLVEAGDLSVRQGRVQLKTLGGLLPVDVVLRRQNSQECDPLELAATQRGIAGLTHAARQRHVAMANALGSGLVESTAFLAFLPDICRSLLGQELLLPSLPTWWCGLADHCQYVLDHLDELVVVPAFRQRGQGGALRRRLQGMDKPSLAELIRQEPISFAAQLRVTRSTVPVWKSDLESAHLALRTYLAASGDSYVVMPGALARVSESNEPLELTIQQGEGSKDVWVLGDDPVEPITLLHEPGQSVELRRTGSELPSRAADNIFWLGRQLERAEGAARLIRSTVSRLITDTGSSSAVEIPVLLRCLADQGQIEPGYAVNEMRSQLPPIDQALPVAVFDLTNRRCLRGVLDELFRLGSTVPDRLSLDTWRIIHRIDDSFVNDGPGTLTLADLYPMAVDLIIDLVAFNGIAVESMTRTQFYRFLELGRRIERSLQIISLIKNFFIPWKEFQGSLLETVLEISDSLMTYRSRYLANLELAAVLDLLLTDETNPRSLAFQLAQLGEHIERLPRDQAQPGYSAEQRLSMSMLQSIRMLDVMSVADDIHCGDQTQLERLLVTIRTQLPKLSEALSHRYLVHAGPAQWLSDIQPET